MDNSIRIYNNSEEVLRIKADCILTEHIGKTGNKMGMKKKISDLLKYAFSLKTKCPICRNVIHIFPSQYDCTVCSKCKNRVVVLPQHIKILKTEDLYIKKVSCFRIAVSKNLNGIKKITSFIKKRGVCEF